MHWPDFDGAAWQELLERADAETLPRAPAPIFGADRDAGAIRASRANAERASVSGDVTLQQAPMSSLLPPDGPGLLITNPPYGVRVGEADRLRDLYARFGAILRERFGGWTAVMLSANRSLEGQTRASWEEIWHTRNGGIPVRLVRTAPRSEIETLRADGA
jgi:putative N6-adenine-specific DNA methylase